MIQGQPLPIIVFKVNSYIKVTWMPTQKKNNYVSVLWRQVKCPDCEVQFSYALTQSTSHLFALSHCPDFYFASSLTYTIRTRGHNCPDFYFASSLTYVIRTRGHNLYTFTTPNYASFPVIIKCGGSHDTPRASSSPPSPSLLLRATNQYVQIRLI
jgi:hypothetical protein